MKNIRVVLYNTKKYNAENIDDVQILENENNATTIEVQFPVEYEDYSKRVEFQNIKGEKWTTSLYAPEDERNKYDENFDKLNFRFTIPSAMTKRGELKVQLIAYLADGTNTIVPFQVIVLTIDNSILYATKEGKKNPELIIRSYEYANMALEISRDAFSRIENAERAALEAEASAKSAQASATSAQNSATNAENSAKSANTRALNAEASAESAQESAEYARTVADDANAKSNNAVSTANGANTKSDSAVSTANTALTNSNNAVTTANTANTKATNAVNTANSANTKSNNAVAIATEAKEIAEEANSISSTANTKSDNAVSTANTANTKSDNAVSTANSANTKSNNAVSTANEAKTSATNAVNTASSANTKSEQAVATANTANTKSDTAVSTANEALETSTEALNQVVSKMGTKIFVGDSTIPESNLNFNSNPQSQITANNTLANSNKSRLDTKDTQITSINSEINKIKENVTIVSNSSGGFSCGSGATNGKGMQFKSFTICDENGKIPIERLIDAIYPIGSIYMSVNAVDPKLLFGGTWEQLKDKFLLGAGSTYANGSTGGASTHTLTTSEMPSHRHGLSSCNEGEWKDDYDWVKPLGNTAAGGAKASGAVAEMCISTGMGQRYVTAYGAAKDGYIMEAVGGGIAHNNMPPYLVVNMWKRTG